VPSTLLRAALDRLYVTSGAHNADANRSGANTDGDIRNSDTADAKPSGANTDGDTRNSGMADSTHNSDAASKDGTDNRSASKPWRRLWIVYQRR
jgi:hypothetical protein